MAIQKVKKGDFRVLVRVEMLKNYGSKLKAGMVIDVHPGLAEVLTNGYAVEAPNAKLTKVPSVKTKKVSTEDTDGAKA